jgi:hypothetical protein
VGDYEIIIRKRGFVPDENIQVAIRLTEEMVDHASFEVLDQAFHKLKEDLVRQLPVKFQTIKKEGLYL